MPEPTVLVFLGNKTLITDQMFNYKSNATLYFEKKKKKINLTFRLTQIIFSDFLYLLQHFQGNQIEINFTTMSFFIQVCHVGRQADHILLTRYPKNEFGQVWF